MAPVVAAKEPRAVDAAERPATSPGGSTAGAEDDAPRADTAARTAAEWARRVHEDGFAALDSAEMRADAARVAAVRAQVLRRYESFLAQAAAAQLDLSQPRNAERLAGFYVRQGGRVDMQLATSAVQTLALDAPVAPVDTAPLLELADKWRAVLSELFAAHGDASVAAGADADTSVAAGADSFTLEYVGCVLSRPGDGDQNWHLDGVHRDPTRHEPADRVNVFLPLVAVDERTGGTEMKRRSHVRRQGDGGARFEAYAQLESVTHLVPAGTPVVMDYRVWHRGLANTSADTIRPLLYFKYALRRPPLKRGAGERDGGKKRKRIAPVPV